MLIVYIHIYTWAWAVVFIIYIRVFGDTSLTDNGNSSHAFTLKYKMLHQGNRNIWI